MLYAGASGFSYPSWKPGFYPAGTPAREFLRSYADRLDSVELNTTGYRLPEEEQFRAWAAETPEGFRFAVKMAHPGQAARFTERVRGLGDRLGPVRVMVQKARDDVWLEQLLGSLDPGLAWALDFRHESWAGVETGRVAVVNELGGDAPFRYVRYREPPYDDAAIAAFAEQLRPVLERDIDVYAYFRHEDEPTAPEYAARLLQLLGAGRV